MVTGAPWRTTFRRITIPLLTPAVINGWLWVALHAMRELSIPLMLSTTGSKVIATVIYERWDAGDVCYASAVGVMLTLTLMLVTFVGRFVVLRRVKTY